MRIKKQEGKFFICTDEDAISNYIVRTGKNGKKFVDRKTVRTDYLNISEGNSKTGKHVINLNFSIEYTCNHSCECYKNSSCYAEGGCYMFSDNQKKYSENVNFFLNSTPDEFCEAVHIAIDTFQYKLFRYFTCGDILSERFFACMVKIAINNPSVKFWSYTKKYKIVNDWIAKNGSLPENLTIIFSHWMNEDGSYFPMENPFFLPTSEYIPYGKEYLKDAVYHVCPCSDPTIKANCETCETPCYNLKKGQSMGLLEHSTQRTKERDKALKDAKKAL